MNQILGVLAALVLALFTLVWAWIAVKVMGYDPTPQAPAYDFSDAQITIAGFLASAVATGTASVLGIEIQKVGGASLAVQVGQAARSSAILLAGILLYAGIGVWVLIVYFFDSGRAPDMVGAFALGVLGWLAGAFAAVFRKATS